MACEGKETGPEKVVNIFISVFILINHPYRHKISKRLDNIRLSFR